MRNVSNYKFTTPDKSLLISEISKITKQIAEMVYSLPNTSIKIPNSKWTVGDAAAHLVISQQLAKDLLKGVKSPYGDGKINAFAEVNDKLLLKFTNRNGKSLADQFKENTQSFLDESKALPASHSLQTHFGAMDLIDLLRYCLTHLLMHSSDIAIALKKPIPVNSKRVELILPFFKNGMVKRYDKEKAKEINLSIDMNIKNVSRFTIACHQGNVTVENKIPESVDCHILVDPVIFFLVATGIVPLWKPLLKGKIIVWGQKPWLTLKLKTLFPNP